MTIAALQQPDAAAKRAALLLCAVGSGFLFLTKALKPGFPFLVVAYGDFFFRYSLFGNLFFIAACFRLYRLYADKAHVSLYIIGMPVFGAHALLSVFDGFGVLPAPAFLDMVVMLFVWALCVWPDGERSGAVRRFFTAAALLPVFLFTMLRIASLSQFLYFVIIPGELYSTLSFFVLQQAAMLRSIEFAAGLMFIAVFLGMYLYTGRSLYAPNKKVRKA